MPSDHIFFFEHLIRPSSYQTVLDLVDNSPEQVRLIRSILLAAVARSLTQSELADEVAQAFVDSIFADPIETLHTLERLDPEVPTLISQSLDRALLGLTAALQ